MPTINVKFIVVSLNNFERLKSSESMCQNKKLIKKLLHEIRQQIVFDVKVLKNCDNLETLIIKTENLGHSEQ